jgi:cytochrome c553
LKTPDPTTHEPRHFLTVRVAGLDATLFSSSLGDPLRSAIDERMLHGPGPDPNTVENVTRLASPISIPEFGDGHRRALPVDLSASAFLRWPLVLACAGLGSVGMALAAGPDSSEQGAAISVQCAACHGSNGISIDTSVPNLAGQHYRYLLDQMRAFKNGSRHNPIMNEMMASLSEQQMKDIAAYFASIQIRVGSRPKGAR